MQQQEKKHMEQIYFLKGHFSEITTVHCSKCVLKVSVLIIISHFFFVTTRIWLPWSGGLFFLLTLWDVFKMWSLNELYQQ